MIRSAAFQQPLIPAKAGTHLHCGHASLALLGLGLASTADHALAADWRIEPVARISSAYTDNPRFLENGESSTGGVGELSASMRRLTERSELTLKPRLRSARYRDDDSLDSDDQFLDAGFKWISERSQWDASANYTRDTTLTSELGSTGFVQGNRRHQAVSASIGPTWMATERLSVGAQAYWLDSSYEDKAFTGLVDYEYRALSLFTGLAASEASDWTLIAQGGELLVSEYGTRTRDATLRLMWTYQPSELWTLKLSGGPAYVDAGADSDTGEVFEVDVSRRAERWNTSLRAGRDLTPTGRGVLTRRDRIVLGVNRRMTERLSTAAFAQWIRNRDLQSQFGQPYEVDYQRVELNLSWRFAERWSVALGASAATQDYTYGDGSTDNYQATLGLVWNGQPRAL